MKVLKDDIKKKEFKKCYLIYGGENFIRQTYLNRIKSTVVTGGFSEMNIDIFEEPDDINTVIDAIQTLPFMSDKRLVIVKNSKLFKAGKKNDSEIMAETIKNISESTCVVFVEEEADKRIKLFKTIEKEGHVALCKTLEGAELYAWAEKEFYKKGVKINRKQTIYFFNIIGNGIENAYSEIEKLSAYKGTNSVVEESDIDEVCTKSAETKIFEMVAAIGKRDTDTALKIYRQLLFMREQPIGILSMIARQFRLILQSGIFLSHGKSISDIAAITGQRDFVIKQCVLQSKNFTSDMLKNALRDCVKSDFSIKSGIIDAETAVEILIVNYSS